MTKNDQPLSEHRVSLTEEELAEELAIPEELKAHTIQQLQEECSFKVESARNVGAMISLISLAATAVLSMLNYENCQERKEHAAEVQHFKELIQIHKKGADELQQELQDELRKTKESLKSSSRALNTTLQLRNSNTQFVNDVIDCNVKNHCLQKALRSRHLKRDKVFKRFRKP